MLFTDYVMLYGGAVEFDMTIDRDPVDQTDITFLVMVSTVSLEIIVIVFFFPGLPVDYDSDV